jgi:hypothetical protein
MTWEAAQANCKKLGGILAIADTQEISDSLVITYLRGIVNWYLPSSSPGAWIGLHIVNGQSVPPESVKWQWVPGLYGRESTGTFWGFRGGALHLPAGACAVLKPADVLWPYGGGEWLGYQCASMAPSFCELPG